MARKNPLPEQEKAICARLRQYREILKLSRVAFAFEIGIDSSGLANYEHARAPLRCDAAYHLLMFFRVNPAWLATGVGPMDVGYSRTLLLPMKEHPRALFSEIFLRHLQDRMSKAVRDYMNSPRAKWGEVRFFRKGSGQTRVNAECSLKEKAEEWIERVPSKNLNDFVNDLIYHGESLLDNYPRDNINTQTNRQKRMIAERVRLGHRRKDLGLDQP